MRKWCIALETFCYLFYFLFFLLNSFIQSCCHFPVSKLIRYSLLFLWDFLALKKLEMKWSTGPFYFNACDVFNVHFLNWFSLKTYCFVCISHVSIFNTANEECYFSSFRTYWKNENYLLKPNDNFFNYLTIANCFFMICCFCLY